MDIDTLLVEDSMNNAELTIRALCKNNKANNIIHLRDGTHALHFFFGKGKYKCSNSDNKPGLIMLDLKMPKVSSSEVLEKLALINSQKNTGSGARFIKGEPLRGRVL